VPAALPGTDEFDAERVTRRQAERAAGRRRRLAVGLALIGAGLVLAVGYAWGNARPGQGSLLLDSPRLLPWLHLASLVVSALSIALVVAGTRLAVDRDARRLSRVWIGAGLVVGVVAVVFLGSIVLLPVKWAHEDLPAAAAERELAAEAAAPSASYCTRPVDPAAFTAWVEDPEVCGNTVQGHRELLIRGPASDARGAFVPQKGLIYSPGHQPTPWDTCIKRLDDVWWEYSSLIDGVSCPSGLTFVPGG
jgi:hypothetical protein